MEVKQRKKGSAGSGSTSSYYVEPPREDDGTNWLKRSAVLTVGIIALLFAFQFWQSGRTPSGSLDHKFAAIIDAGSTGSRILIFHFHTDDGTLRLSGEFFKEIKPGLSFYAKNPRGAADSLRELLSDAKSEVPNEFWGKTPLVLKATAGLRLLPGDRAKAILNEVTQLFSECPFQVTTESVSIMEGTDEGLFAWFTVNFLLGQINSSDLDKTVAVMDLGGGSTQIAFAPVQKDTISNAPTDHIYSLPIDKQDLTLFIHSYLGLGLMAARFEIIKVSSSNDVPYTYNTHCFHPNANDTWQYAGKTHAVSGVEEAGEASFEKCYYLAQKLVTGHPVHRPSELNERRLFTMSYYFDRAVDADLIDPRMGGIITVGDFFKAGKKACSQESKEMPFLCMDLTYISALLKDGLGLSMNKEIELRKKIDGHELSWALGAAFQTLSH